MRSTLEAWDAEMVEVNGIAEAKTETMEEQAADPCDVMEPERDQMRNRMVGLTWRKQNQHH